MTRLYPVPVPLPEASRHAPVERSDAHLIVTARGVRSFAYGLLAVALGLALLQRGLTPVQIGSLITVSLVGDGCGTYVIALHADGWGRRRTLVGLALLMALTGTIFGVVRFYPVLLVAAFFGTLGALAAGVPAVQVGRGHGPDDGFGLVCALYVGAALVAALLAWRLSPQVETPGARTPSNTGRWSQLAPPLGRSRGIVLRLAALFSVDALAGGLVVQSLLVLYFHLRFGVPLAPLAALFFGANTLSALSFLAAAPLARRFGLLNTMVFTHLPSNLLLALVAFMPTFPLAAGALLLRQALSQMDIPTRQTYTMALVAPDERTAAASVTSLARSAGSATTPVVAGALLQGSLLTLGLPLLIAGGLKSAYDLTLWAIFRRVRPAEGEGLRP